MAIGKSKAARAVMVRGRQVFPGIPLQPDGEQACGNAVGMFVHENPSVRGKRNSSEFLVAGSETVILTEIRKIIVIPEGKVHRHAPHPPIPSGLLLNRAEKFVGRASVDTKSTARV